MFNNGDKVICINPFTTVNVNGPTKLIIGKTYIVGYANDDIKFILLENVFGIFDPEKFL